MGGSIGAPASFLLINQLTTKNERSKMSAPSEVGTALPDQVGAFDTADCLATLFDSVGRNDAPLRHPTERSAFLKKWKERC